MTNQKLTAEFPTAALAFALLLLASPVSARTILIDGDTIDVDGVRIRIAAIDTPETFRPRCERERALGIAAKERLRELLDAGAVTFTPTGVDRYGRTLAHVFVNGGADVGETLIKENHAVRWKPGAVAKAARLAAWCGP